MLKLADTSIGNNKVWDFEYVYIVAPIQIINRKMFGLFKDMWEPKQHMAVYRGSSYGHEYTTQKLPVDRCAVDQFKWYSL